MQYPTRTNGLASNPTLNHSSAVINQTSLQNLCIGQSVNVNPLFTQQVPPLHPQRAHEAAALTQVYPNPVRNQNQAPNPAVGGSGTAHPHLFQYPGGVHISTPHTSKAITLADIATLSREMPLGKTGGQSVINVARLPGVFKEMDELTISRKLLGSETNCDTMDWQVRAQSDNQSTSHEGLKKADSVVAKPLVPHTPSLSPASHSTQSPLLFDSCESSTETPSRIHSSLAAKLAEKMNKPQLVPRLNITAETSLTPQPLHPISTTEDSSHAETRRTNTEDKKSRHEAGSTTTGDDVIIIDEDLTPPISPAKPQSPHPWEETSKQHELQHDRNAPAKTPPALVLNPVENTPLGQPKRRANTRLAARKSKSSMRHPVIEERVPTPRKVTSRVNFTSEDSDEADFKPGKSKTPSRPAAPPSVVQVCWVTLITGLEN